MKTTLQTLLAGLILLCGAMLAQQSGTVNSLSVNPRQNQELTCSTGTASGQPSDAVPCSDTQPNGLISSTSEMAGSGSNGNMNQPPAKPERTNASSSANAAQQKAPAQNGSQQNSKAHK